MCPMKNSMGMYCNVRDLSYSNLVQHYAIEHGMGKIMDTLWQLIYFNTSFLTEELNNPPPVEDAENSIHASCSQFTNEELLGEKESTMSMKLAKTLKQVGLNKTLIQPAACFALCDKLEPCHECLKVKQQIGTVGSVCQFEGFRKIKRIISGLEDPFRFEAC